MEKVCEELDEAKAEIENLREDLKSKLELCNILKKVHNEQLIKTQEVSMKIEKQNEELNEKAEEISELKQMNDDLKCRLNERESITKHLNAANDKLRADCNKKYRKWEEENRVLLLALDEANERNTDQEQKIHVCMAEIEGLKGLLSVSEKKCKEAEKKAKASKELRSRENVLDKLEEENQKLEDRLKWKKEQFQHLEEAHKNLRDHFQTSKKEWEQERLALIDEISSLQSRVDSHTRISEDLQHRLKTCNQALAYEESRRKYMETELSEFKTRFESVFTECQETKSQLEFQTAQRDNEIAALRHSLDTKEAFYKEMEYRAGKLEQERLELLESLRELQESGINNLGNSSSLGRLRNRFKNLEQMHKGCSANLRAKEAEWSSRLDKTSAELNAELDEERKKSACLLARVQSLEEHALQMESDSKMKLQEVSDALNMANFELAEERGKTYSLGRRVESLELLKEQLCLMQKDLESYREMLEESSKHKLQLEEQVLQMKTDSNGKLGEGNDDLDIANSELDERICAAHEIEFELWIWKSIAQRLKDDLENNQELRKELEASLLAQVVDGETTKKEREDMIHMLDERDSEIYNLQKQIVLLEQKIKSLSSAPAKKTLALVSEKEIFLQEMSEKDKTLEALQKEIGWLEQESLRRELEGMMFAQITTERSFEDETKNLILLVEGKDRKIGGLLQLVKSLEQQFNDSLISFSSQLAEKQMEINMAHEAWEKITLAEILAELEIEEKKLMIVELEDNICEIQKKLEFQENFLSHSKQHALQIEAEVKAKETEMKNLANQVESKLRVSDVLINELREEKQKLHEEVMELLSQRENLLHFIEVVSDRISTLSIEDVKLMGMLARTSDSVDRNGSNVVSPGNNGQLDTVKENATTRASSSPKKFEVVPEGRSPFRELN